MNIQSNLRQYIASILTEIYLQNDELGLIVITSEYTRVGVIYKWDDVPCAVNKFDSDKIIGMIRIDKPANSCNGAWEVKEAAGRYLSGAVYDLGYWLAREKPLISDRSIMTSDAVNAWYKFSNSGKGDGSILDNEDAPSNSNPFDDCAVWKGSDNGTILNWNDSVSDRLPRDVADSLNKSYVLKTHKWDWTKIQKRTIDKVGLSIYKSSKFITQIKKSASEFFTDKT